MRPRAQPRAHQKRHHDPLASYAYDALSRRISENGRDLYYSANWQVIEERQGSQLLAQNVWSLAYIDAMICRDQDSNSDGTLDQRLYVQQDANFNVRSITDVAGAVLERYEYDRRLADLGQHAGQVPLRIKANARIRDVNRKVC